MGGGYRRLFSLSIKEMKEFTKKNVPPFPVAVL